MRRKILISGALLAITIMFVGCGSSSSSNAWSNETCDGCGGSASQRVGMNEYYCADCYSDYLNYNSDRIVDPFNLGD